MKRCPGRPHGKTRRKHRKIFLHVQHESSLARCLDQLRVASAGGPFKPPRREISQSRQHKKLVRHLHSSAQDKPPPQWQQHHHQPPPPQQQQQQQWHYHQQQWHQQQQWQQQAAQEPGLGQPEKQPEDRQQQQPERSSKRRRHKRRKKKPEQQPQAQPHPPQQQQQPLLPAAAVPSDTKKRRLQTAEEMLQRYARHDLQKPSQQQGGVQQQPMNGVARTPGQHLSSSATEQQPQQKQQLPQQQQQLPQQQQQLPQQQQQLPQQQQQLPQQKQQQQQQPQQKQQQQQPQQKQQQQQQQQPLPQQKPQQQPQPGQLPGQPKPKPQDQQQRKQKKNKRKHKKNKPEQQQQQQQQQQQEQKEQQEQQQQQQQRRNCPAPAPEVICITDSEEEEQLEDAAAAAHGSSRAVQAAAAAGGRHTAAAGSDHDVIVIDSDSSDAEEQEAPPAAAAAGDADAAAAALGSLQLDGTQQQQQHMVAALPAVLPGVAGQIAVPAGVLGSRPSSLARAAGANWSSVAATLAGMPGQRVVAQLQWGPSLLEVLRSDLARLRPGEWLNDELVNFYLVLVQARTNRIMRLQQQLQAAPRPSSPQHDRTCQHQQQQQPQRAKAAPCRQQVQQLPPELRRLQAVPSSFIFSSYFYELLARGPGKQYNYGAVKRWTLPRRTNTPDCVLRRQLLLFPINLSNTHWAVVAVWPQRRLLQYFDSSAGSRGSGGGFMAHLARWLREDATDKGVALPPGELRCEAVTRGMPLQADGSSCGLFAVSVCERLAAGWSPPFDFSQADMRALRVGMALDILQRHVA